MTRNIGATPAIVRGRIYGATLGEHGEKYFLVVSNNGRNRYFDDFIGLRFTSTPQKPYRSKVEFGSGESTVPGWVLADSIMPIRKVRVTREIGAVSPGGMARVEQALHAALGMNIR